MDGVQAICPGCRSIQTKFESILDLCPRVDATTDCQRALAIKKPIPYLRGAAAWSGCRFKMAAKARVSSYGPLSGVNQPLLPGDER